VRSVVVGDVCSFSDFCMGASAVLHFFNTENAWKFQQGRLVQGANCAWAASGEVGKYRGGSWLGTGTIRKNSRRSPWVSDFQRQFITWVKAIPKPGILSPKFRPGFCANFRRASV
jgi:hypothetical protein